MPIPPLDRRRFFQAVGAAGIAATLPGVTAIPAMAQSADRPAASSWRARKKFATVKGRQMAYVEAGEGRPVVFLHGNPTSSYLWRNIMPHVQDLGRCIAPDLIGMGDSDKLPNAVAGTYDFLTHREYLFDLLGQIGVGDDVTLVVHDWGSGLGLDHAANNPAAIRGIAWMEAILRMPGSPPPQRENVPGLFGQFLTEAGETMVLQDNIFVEQLLIGGLGQYITDADRAEYRRPFLEPGAGRWPSLEWPRELPGFSDVTAPIAENYTGWLAQSDDVPKLFIRANPGAILSNPELLEYVRAFPNQTETTVYGTHYVQEFAPDAIGRSLREWLLTLA